MGLLKVRPRQTRPDRQVLDALLPARPAVNLGRAGLILWAGQQGPRLRIVLIIHHHRRKLQHLRLHLTVTRGRKLLWASPPTLCAELGSEAIVLARLDLMIKPIARTRRLRLGLTPAGHFTPTRPNGTARRRALRWAFLDRLRLRLACMRWGSGAATTLSLTPAPQEAMPDPLDHSPAWEFFTLHCPAHPRSIEEMRHMLACAMES